MIRSYSRFNRISSRRHIANAEDKCRQILTDIYNCIAENYKKYGFDIDVMTAPCYAESDCSWLWEELDENLSSLDIEPVRWRDHCDEANNERRRTIQTVLYFLLNSYLCFLAPIIPHTA